MGGGGGGEGGPEHVGTRPASLGSPVVLFGLFLPSEVTNPEKGTLMMICLLGYQVLSSLQKCTNRTLNPKAFASNSDKSDPTSYSSKTPPRFRV